MDEIRKDLSEKDMMSLFDDTSKLLAEKKRKALISATTSYLQDNALTEKVEFWKWMEQNYSSVNGHMISSNSAMKDYISQGSGKANCFYKQVQGKGYEWDWMQKQHRNIRNLTKKYDAGTVSNQPGYEGFLRSIAAAKGV